MTLLVGKIYRLKFPGFAARVIKPSAGGAPASFPFLVESLFVHGRWHVNDRGVPNNGDAPVLLVKRGIGETSAVALAVALLFALYLPAALWLHVTYPGQKLPPPPGAIKQLVYFHKLVDDGFTYISPFQWDDLGDTSKSKDSPIMLYEDNHPLGPAHSVHADIEKIGLGRFSHWKSLGIVFSTSDNSDPNKNGRNYWVVLPPK